MTVHPTFPGVYVQEVPSGVRTIMGVSTSTALFIGRSTRGPMNRPVRCLNYTDFVRTFSDDTSAGALASYVKLFFLNGGTDCYIMRIANGAKRSYVTLLNNDATPADVLLLTAKDPGIAGEQIRAAVTYNGPQPEFTFNLDLFRWVVDSAGNRTKQGAESFKNLSMDPAAPLFVETVVTQNSKLVSATSLATAPSTGGFSLSGTSVVATVAQFSTKFIGQFLTDKKFRISIGGSPFVEIDLHTATLGTAASSASTGIKAAIEAKFSLLGLPPVDVTVTFPNGPVTNSKRLNIQAAASTPGKDVLVRSAATATDDMCAPLKMGAENGGLEVGAWASKRPAANGIVTAADLATLNDLEAAATASITLDMQNPDGSSAGAQPIPVTISATDTTAQARLGKIASAINTYVPTSSAVKKWSAEAWGSRLAVIPTGGDDNFESSLFAVSPTSVQAHFGNNVHYYSLGIGGRKSADTPSANQKPAPQTDIGSDGSAPLESDYQSAYTIVDKEVDLFNLMVLPPDADPSAAAMSTIYPNASVFCQQRRAFLLMDPPTGWSGAQLPTAGAASLSTLRTGLVKDHSAIFYPRLVIDDKGLQKSVGPSGAIAGLCARIDGTRGVHKAPAGTEADLRGILGVEQRFSDGENGILNPRAVNTIRVFPSGIVNWGARTMDGDDDFASEYKYIPIRRLALYLEESLYRGLKWVVFEPNDEPLYAQIRLNVGSFMHSQFRQGAFQGSTPKDAYFVKCDRETTTESDRNQGIVNIWVGFAPLKPAEFVILYLQQMAGQIQV